METPSFAEYDLKDLHRSEAIRRLTRVFVGCPKLEVDGCKRWMDQWVINVITYNP